MLFSIGPSGLWQEAMASGISTDKYLRGRAAVAPHVSGLAVLQRRARAAASTLP